MGDIQDMENKGILSNKLNSLEYVQISFNDEIHVKTLKLLDDLVKNISDRNKEWNPKTLGLFDEYLISNLKELELNISMTIVNFQRITGLKLKPYKKDLYKKKRSLLKKGQLLFLLDGNTSEVYGKNLVYLHEELKRSLLELKISIEGLVNLEEEKMEEYLIKIDREYFRINSDIYEIIDDINETIDRVYSNISGNRDKNINLSFLLVSAFLSVILFFPEFSNMLNLQNQELTFEEKMDEIIYEKVMENVELEELLDIKLNMEDYLEEIPYSGDLDEGMVKEVILTNIHIENNKLETEKNRINIFVKILFLILIPFLIWIVFISV